jgi:hypothetical protein
MRQQENCLRRAHAEQRYPKGGVTFIITRPFFGGEQNRRVPRYPMAS